MKELIYRSFVFSVALFVIFITPGIVKGQCGSSTCADFTPNTSQVVNVGDDIVFTHACAASCADCNPVSCHDGGSQDVFDFYGGTPAQLMGPGPHTITYNSAGTYDVCLNAGYSDCGSQWGLDCAMLGFVGLVTVNSVTPVKMLHAGVSIVQKDNSALLEWTTVMEENNDYFVVEKSPDMQEWTHVGSVNGAGNSNVEIRYSFTDPQPLPGISYYRLKQTDFDGKFKYYGLGSVRNGSHGLSFNLYPNPSGGGYFNMKFSGLGEKEILVVVYDINGRESFAKILLPPSAGGSTYAAIDPSGGLPKGVYMVVASSENRMFRKKIVVQ